MNELVILQDKQAVTSSLNLAENFEKKHQHILRDIDSLKEDVQNWTDLFFETEYTHPQNKQKYPIYYMNRDGFTLLAMGFTGKKALKFKLEYIDAFNEMEKRLRIQAPTNMVEALTLALEQQKTIQVQNQVIGELKPKADYMDKILKSKSLVTITQIAKDYGLSGVALNQILNDLGIQYKQSGQWLLYAKFQAKGYTHSETVNIERTGGIHDVKMNTKWTQKGRLFLYDILKENDYIPTIEQD